MSHIPPKKVDTIEEPLCIAKSLDWGQTAQLFINKPDEEYDSSTAVYNLIISQLRIGENGETKNTETVVLYSYDAICKLRDLINLYVPVRRLGELK